MLGRLLIGCAVLLVVGCGKPKLAEVSGTVKLDGKPLADASVSFQPIGDGTLNPGAGSYAKTDANGHYVLTQMGGAKGALVGMHKVEISKTTNANPDDDRSRPTPEKVPARYNTKSELTCEVLPGGRDDANFDLETKDTRGTGDRKGPKPK